MSLPNELTGHLKAEMTAWRRDLHRHPELGFDEHRTAGAIAKLLRSFGLEVREGVGRTGVVGRLRRGASSRRIALRADIDALPIQEADAAPHRSVKDGVMHACGHDGHTAMLLGAAKHLAQSDLVDGEVLFLFQPNEENGLGAAAMLADGALDSGPVDAVYGLHNLPGLPVGAFATRAGAITASESLFEIEIHGQGGHAALPHMGVDAVLVGAEIVCALQSIVSRRLDPGRNGVVSVTEFLADGRRNVLAGRSTLKGDARALTPEANAAIEAEMRRIVDGVCAAHGARGETRYDTVFAPTLNAPAPTIAAAQAARSVTDASAVDDACAPMLFSEDFAQFALDRPGCFMLIGNGVDGAHGRPLHSADYAFNDALLVLGSSYWVSLARQQLAKGEGAGGAGERF